MLIDLIHSQSCGMPIKCWSYFAGLKRFSLILLSTCFWYHFHGIKILRESHDNQCWHWTPCEVLWWRGLMDLVLQNFRPSVYHVACNEVPRLHLNGSAQSFVWDSSGKWQSTDHCYNSSGNTVFVFCLSSLNMIFSNPTKFAVYLSKISLPFAFGEIL